MAAWIKIPLGTDVCLGPGDVVLDGDRAPPAERGQQPPTFQPMSVVGKLSPISATAGLLLHLVAKIARCALDC